MATYREDRGRILVEAFTAGILSTLGITFVVSIRYVFSSIKHSRIYALAFAVEATVFALLLLFFASQLFVREPWLDIALRPLLWEIWVSFSVIVILAVFFWVVTKLERGGRERAGVFFFGLTTAGVFGIFLLGIWSVQSTVDISDLLLAKASKTSGSSPSSGSPPIPTPTPTLIPTATPRPTPTATPTPGPTDVETILTRNPHLGNCSTDSITVSWRTNVAATSLVKYGPTPLMRFKSSDDNTRFDHSLTLNNLKPNTRYFYQAISNRQPLAPPGTFTTYPPRSGSNFSFLVFGDSGVGGSEQFAIASRLTDTDADFLLHTGDVIQVNDVQRAFLIEQGLMEGFEFNPVLTRGEVWEPYYFLPYEDILSSKCIFAVPGNHDTHNYYQENLYLPSNNPDKSEFYYSFDYGRSHFIAIDANKESSGIPGYEDTPQFRWLKDDLERASQNKEIDWIIVFLHQSPFASGAVNINPNSRGRFMARTYVPLFEQFKVDIVFGGHDHTYERSCYLFEDACVDENATGVLYVVTGGGGHPQLASNECGKGCPWSEFRSSVFHFVKIEIQESTLTGEAIDINGMVFDKFVVNKYP